MFWKEDWDIARDRLTKWWGRKGLAVCITAPKEIPWEDIPEPRRPDGLEAYWTDPVWRAKDAEFQLSRTFFGGEAFPYFDTQIGPGNLATFIGSAPKFAEETVWFEPCITIPDNFTPLNLNEPNTWWNVQLALINEGLKIANGCFLVGMPDLVENLDILASLRGTQTVLTNLIERSDFVKERIREINLVFFEAFNAIYERIKDDRSGNAFSAFRIWGPGKTAKVQCDISAMISPKDFAEFVVPSLAEQCRWLDYSLFHLDGTDCICHLSHLLAIKELDAIEWTPQACAGIPGGGSKQWYGLYKQILSAGKAVQAICVEIEEIEPLIEAVGHEGLFIMTTARSEKDARKLLRRVERWR